MTFANDLSTATTADAAFAALHAHSQSILPVRLWTVMTVDMDAGIARRAYTSHPHEYPTSGTKPVPNNDWFAQVCGRHEPFVANTLAQIAEVFPDHEIIGTLGCASVVNLPFVLGGTLAGTVNLLDVENYFTPDRVAHLRLDLTLPAVAAIAVARALTARA